MIWLTSSVTNLKQYQGSKPSPLLKLRDAQTLVIQTHSVASYGQAGLHGGCNSDALTFKGNPSARGAKLSY
jgi:hypothetical protein